jgi:hypothetical protein
LNHIPEASNRRPHQYSCGLECHDDAPEVSTRRGKNTQFHLADLLRQSVYSRFAGYEDMNDTEQLCHDPTFRLIGSEKIWDRGATLA